MATTFSAAGAAVTANAAGVATETSLSLAEVQAIGAFLTACGEKPGLSVEILRLINNANLTENRP